MVMRNESSKDLLLKALWIGAVLLLSAGLVVSVLLVLFVVPAPNPQTAVEVTGRLNRINPPHPHYGDLAINLVDGRHYYVNRADEVPYFEWQRLLEEVRPGDSVTLTVVQPLAWRLFGSGENPVKGPVAGVRSGSTVYMDPAIAARTWKAQSAAVRNTLLLIGLLALLNIISRLSGRLKSSLQTQLSLQHTFRLNKSRRRGKNGRPGGVQLVQVGDRSG
jgi:hypothetical protein